jgi:hypothetical protein
LYRRTSGVVFRLCEFGDDLFFLRRIQSHDSLLIGR